MDTRDFLVYYFVCNSIYIKNAIILAKIKQNITVTTFYKNGFTFYSTKGDNRIKCKLKREN